MISVGFSAQTVVAADFTGHGLVDVISNDGQRTLLFIAPDWNVKTLQEETSVVDSVVMDVNLDGRPDYIGAQCSPGRIFWLEQPATPESSPWPLHVIDDAEHGGADGVHGLAVGDIAGDGRPGLAATSSNSKGKLANSILWYRVPEGTKRNGLWERWVAGRWDAPGMAQHVAIGDVNGDGRLDIASAARFPPDGNWFAWWEQPDTWDQPFKKHVIATGQEGATHILIADINGDGKMDFVASRGHGHGVVWFEGPNWIPHEIDPNISGPLALALGDISGHGHVDIATVAKNDFLAVWYENDGKGNFRRHVIARNQAAADIRLVDMDGDGDLDLLVAGEDSRNLIWYENPAKRR